jgi:head-tail adaptor
MDFIGQFKQIVTLKNPAKVSDGAGGYTETYSAFATDRWASVIDKGGNRYFAEGQLGQIDRKEIRILWDFEVWSDLSLDSRVEYGGKDYSIERISQQNEERIVIKIEVTALS